MGEGALVVYYNEIDPYCCQWLRNLIVDEQLPFGEVDQRDIREVSANDVKGYRQCHWFAGIGGWAYALELAGWPADRGVWTGSCPCQPFSCAGKRQGEADDRHLWPDWGSLISICRPPVVFGEQVAGRAGRGWLSGVRADLEAMGYGVGAADLCAAGTGAPHIRQRLFWVAESSSERRQQVGRGPSSHEETDGREPHGNNLASGDGEIHSGVADGAPDRRQQVGEDGRGGIGGSGAEGRAAGFGLRGASGRVADRLSPRLEERPVSPAREECAAVERGGDAGRLGNAEYSERRPEQQKDSDASRRDGSGRAGNTSGMVLSALEQVGISGRAREPRGAWSSYDLIPCIDGKTRRIEPGSFPLAHGISARVGKLRAYGNAIVPQAAAEFIRAFMDCR